MKLLVLSGLLLVTLSMQESRAEEPTPKAKEAAQFLIHQKGYVCDNVNYIVTEDSPTGDKHIVVCNDLRFRYEITRFKNQVIVRSTIN
jgi:hypothetical protein